jgi:hypothetical protein
MGAQSEAMKRHIDKKRAYVRDYKAERGCLRCGEKDPIVLDLDHRDPETNGRIPAYASAKYYRTKRWHQFSWEDLDAELAKCDVLCANCHRRKTHAERDWEH